MTTMTFDAVSEDLPGPRWLARWHRSWPTYEAWFIARGSDGGPDAATCRAAMERHMPKLLATYDRLVAITGGADRALAHSVAQSNHPDEPNSLLARAAFGSKISDDGYAGRANDGCRHVERDAQKMYGPPRLQSFHRLNASARNWR